MTPLSHTLSTPRSARFYTLGSTDGPAEGPAGDVASEVWVVLHGYGQSAARFLSTFAGIASPRRLVVAPEALSRFYFDRPGSGHARVGASWMTREDREAEIADYVAYLDGVVEAVSERQAFDLAAVRLVTLGFSQGAATAARWLARSPRLAARCPRTDRLVLWGADLPHDLDYEAAGAWLPAVDLTLVVGDQDEYATAERVAAMEERLQRAGIPYRLLRYTGGHRIVEDVLQAFIAP